MITNQNMIRKMGNFEVTQRTKDGFFNATALLKQWNEQSGQNKMMAHYLENKTTEEFINALLSEENLPYRNSVIIKSKASKGINAGTWMHPLLFIDFAMWLNPTFKVKVLKFVADEMIKYRNLAGDSYKELSSAIGKIVPKDFMATAMKKVAEAINWIVFKEHRTGIRNDFGEEQKQQELCEFQRKIASLIDEGFINSFEHLMDYLRNSYKRVHLPKVFIS